MSVASRDAQDSGAFSHEAFFYEGSDDYIRGTSRFIGAGLDADDVILVAVPAVNTELIRQTLGSAASRVQFVNMAELGRNPGRIIPIWLEFVALNAEAGRTVRGIGEPVWAGRSPAALVECQWHESLLNLAFAGGPAFPLMCPYDVETLSVDVLAEAERSHPFVLVGGGRLESSVYRGAPEIDHHLDDELSPPPPQARMSVFEVGDLNAVRSLVDECAAEIGLDRDRVADLVLAVNEAATNSVRHGGGRGVLRVWTDAQTMVCEVSDTGRIAKALAGRHLRSVTAMGGRGLWLIHQLCDLVEVRSGANGTTVRMSAQLR